MTRDGDLEYWARVRVILSPRASDAVMSRFLLECFHTSSVIPDQWIADYITI